MPKLMTAGRGKPIPDAFELVLKPPVAGASTNFTSAESKPIFTRLVYVSPNRILSLGFTRSPTLYPYALSVSVILSCPSPKGPKKIARERTPDECTKLTHPPTAKYDKGSQAIVGVTKIVLSSDLRSEERRVGKECRSRWWAYM